MFESLPRQLLLVVVVGLLSTSLVHAQREAAPATTSAIQWGHWRGENGNAVSTTAQPPTQWSATENIKWKVPVPGRGSGSPVVWGDRVFVLTATEEVRDKPSFDRDKFEFKVLCYNRADGELLWEETAIVAAPHEGTHGTNGYSSASPCTDGKHVFASFGSQGIHCYTVEGQHVWSRQLGKMTMRGTFGEGSSPVLTDDKVIVPWDHEGQSNLFALDKKSGEIVWQTPRDEPSCWATPLVIEHAGRKQIITNGENKVRAYDLQTGKELWNCGGQTQRPVACPVAADGLVFVGSGHRGSFLAAFRPDGQGDVRGTEHVVWSKQRDTPDIASPLLSGGRLYYTKAKTGILTCVDAATGKPHFSAKRLPLKTLYASPVAAGGHVYLSDRDGKTVVIEDAEQLKIVAENDLGETIDATPVPVGKQLLIRGERHLFCVE